MRFSIPFTIFLLLISSFANAGLPENDLWKEDVMPLDDDVSRERFEGIIDEVAAVYKPIVADMGANLVFEKNWTDSTVNAYAFQEGKTWTVAMFGGLARRPEVTPDGFMLVVCHEVGHHIAGYPFYSGQWASSEGESDRFATHACARKIWGSDYRQRVKAASLSLATLLAKLGGEPAPSLSKKDMSVVSETDPTHPPAQCRLDTMIAGMVCSKSFPTDIIPGMSEFGVGYNTLDAELESLKYTCENRPRCWFSSLK